MTRRAQTIFAVIVGALASFGLALILCGCSVVSANRVFPKLAWAWSDDAKEQRRENAISKANAEAAKQRNAPKTP